MCQVGEQKAREALFPASLQDEFSSAMIPHTACLANFPRRVATFRLSQTPALSATGSLSATGPSFADG